MDVMFLYNSSVYPGKLRHSGYRRRYVNSVAKAVKRLCEIRAMHSACSDKHGPEYKLLKAIFGDSLPF